MTDQHPLTDEIMYKLHGNKRGYSNPFDADDMRAAYDKGADWQLGQVVAWLEDNLGSSMYLQLVEDNILGESGTEVNVGYVIQHLREEMRPL